MKITNVRLGHACNSSSTHSMIFLPNQQDDFDENNNYGWQFFTLASSEARLGYLAAILYQNLERMCQPKVANAIVRQFCGVNTDNRIDHQSMVCLPADYHTGFIDIELFEDLQKYILQDGLVILGGNDNDDLQHPLYGNGEDAEQPIKPLTYVRYNDVLTCRKDTVNNYWTLFNKYTGTKVRLSFDNNATITKATFPELVDLKITDNCEFGCKWCYQGSTPNGKHAEYRTLSYLLYQLSQRKVFEVAIGGGEPTLHPNFIQLLETCRKFGIVPNFTTINLSYLSYKEGQEAIDLCGAFAFTVHDHYDVEELSNIITTNKHKCTIQVVIGTIDEYALRKIIIAALDKFNITLLGYKNTGRGKHFSPIQCDWIKVVSGIKALHRIGIDTMLARQYHEQIKELCIPQWQYETEEGKFSAYIDAVNYLIGPSSYKLDKLIPVKRCVDELAEHFKEW